jgi:hypothetical protein
MLKIPTNAKSGSVPSIEVFTLKISTVMILTAAQPTVAIKQVDNAHTLKLTVMTITLALMTLAIMQLDAPILIMFVTTTTLALLMLAIRILDHASILQFQFLLLQIFVKLLLAT